MLPYFCLCIGELQRFMSMHAVHASNEEAAALLAGLDIRGDGCVTFKVFMAAIMPRLYYLNPEAMQCAFDAMDTDKDGEISREDLQARHACHLILRPASFNESCLRFCCRPSSCHFGRTRNRIKAVLAMRLQRTQLVMRSFGRVPQLRYQRRWCVMASLAVINQNG